MTDGTSCREGGFTLIEVLVALVIFGLSCTVLLNVAAGGLKRGQDSAAEMAASALAESLLLRAGKEFVLKEGSSEGQTDDGLQWTMQVSSFGDSADREARGIDAKLVTVAVNWEERAGRRVVMSTLVLVPGASK